MDLPNFYDDELISDYEGKNIIYIAHIGKYNNEELFKFGLTDRIFSRDLKEHRKTFEKLNMSFNMVRIIRTDNCGVVENYFKKQLEALHIKRVLVSEKRKITELFTVTNKYGYDDIIKILKKIIRNNPLSSITELKEKLAKCKKNKENETLNYKDFKN